MRTLSLMSGLLLSSVGFLNAEVVAPGSMGNWSFSFLDNGFNVCGSCQNGSMVYGPATPPLGVGSANIGTTPGNGAGAATIGTTDLNGIALSALTALTYSTYDTLNNGSQFPFLRLHISYTGTANGGGAGSDSLFFEPPYQTPATGNPSLPTQGNEVMNLWQNWNALAGGWWDNNNVAHAGQRFGGPGGTYDGVAPLSTFLSFYTSATITGSSFFNNDGLVYGW